MSEIDVTSPILIYEINSIEELTQKLPHKGAFQSRNIYRGQESADWNLVPSFFRLSTQIFTNWEHLEGELLRQFQKQALPFLQIVPQNKIEWLALAQHHGLPTRLLDWTENPLVALYFAVSNLNADCDSAVWSADAAATAYTIQDNLEGFHDGMRYYPAFTTPRISAQRGCFTIHNLPIPPESNFSVDLERFVPLETPNRNPPTFMGKLTKYIIRASVRERIKWDLDKVGIDPLALFPDLDGLCTKLLWDLDKASHFKGSLTNQNSLNSLKNAGLI